MPGIRMDEIEANDVLNEPNSSHLKEDSSPADFPPSLDMSLSVAIEQSGEDCVETTIEQLYENVCEMGSSGDESPLQECFRSEGDESRMDSELCHLVGGETKAAEILEEEEEAINGADDVVVDEGENGTSSMRSDKRGNAQSPSRTSVSSKKCKKSSLSQPESNGSVKSSARNKAARVKRSQTGADDCGILLDRENNNPVDLSADEAKSQNVNGDAPPEANSDSPEAGPALLKHARDLICQDNPRRALRYALRASKAFEKGVGAKSRLDLTMSLHVLAAIRSSLGQYELAVTVLNHSLEIPAVEEGLDHALAEFSGHMQLGDTYAMMGQTEKSLRCYVTGLEVQKLALGDTDPRVAETYRFLAEAHVQALQFDEAERLCQAALDIHKQNGNPSTPGEAADRRLMGLIYDTKGNYEAALEHLLLATMSMESSGQEMDVASVDCSIGDAYLSLARYDEAVFAYQKAISMFKSTKGENHPTVASVLVRLADLHNKVGKLKESKTCCKNALQIYGKQLPGTTPEEIATGLTDLSAIYESMNEREESLKLLKKALKIYKNAPGHQSTIAGIEAQMGVMYYITGKYEEAYNSFKGAITKLRASGDRSAFFGVALNHMGLACVQRQVISEAAELFAEAKMILEKENGPYHPDVLGASSNLAGAYDAMGRLDEAIEILDHIVGIREDVLGTAGPDVDEEKKRLAALLKETGRVRARKARSLETLLDTSRHDRKNETAAAAKEVA